MKRPSRMQYQPNKTGYYMMLLFIILNLVYTIQSLETMATTIYLGFDTMINITILLAGFLASAKIKVYSKSWSNAALGFAAFQLLRMLWTPGLQTDWAVYLILSAVAALFASYITLHKINILNRLDTIVDNYPSTLISPEEPVEIIEEIFETLEQAEDTLDVFDETLEEVEEEIHYPKLALQGVNKVYPNGVHAVKNFNLDIEEKEFIVLVGPSGCGKSTTLRMIAGLEGISSGKMFLYDKQINKLAPSDRDVAMIFQDYALYGHMSVYENMGFSLRLRHENDIYIHDKVIEASKIVQLEDELNRLPKNLSGGQRQRVALGRSIVRNAQVFLMDEPLSNLDAKLRDSTRKEIVKLHQELEATIVYVTHDQVEAMTMATRIVVMNEGYIQQVGTPSEVYNKPENLFVASFMGMPPMNFFKGEVKGINFVSNDLVLPLNQKQIEMVERYKGRNITLGIRPEYFSTDLQHINENSWIMDVKVQMVEYSGSSQVVTFNLSGQTINAKLHTRDTIEIDDVIQVAIKRDAVLLFDEQSTLRIHDDYQQILTTFDGEYLTMNEEQLLVPNKIKTLLKRYVDKEIVLNFKQLDFIKDDSNGWNFNAFDVIPFGDLNQITLVNKDVKVVARMDNSFNYEVDQNYKMNFNFDKVYFEDVATNTVIKGSDK